MPVLVVDAIVTGISTNSVVDLSAATVLSFFDLLGVLGRPLGGPERAVDPDRDMISVVALHNGVLVHYQEGIRLETILGWN